MNEARILIVEQEEKIAAALSIGLKENGFNVCVVPFTKPGMELNEANDFDLIILDIDNDLEDCRNFYRIVREKKPHIPIIILTILNRWENTIGFFDRSLANYIAKPFEFKELHSMVIKLLLSPKVPVHAGNFIHAGDLQLDMDSKKVRRGNMVISLSSMEFRLLEYFLKNRDKVISYSEIAVNIWGIDSGIEKKNVDVYISYLRNKLDKPFGQSLIQRLPGIGYIFEVDLRY